MYLDQMDSSADGMVDELGVHAGVGEQRHQDRVRCVWKRNVNSNHDLKVQFHQRNTHSFYAHRSQKYKMADDLTVIFPLLGSMRVKVVRKMLMPQKSILTLICRLK